MYNAAEFPWYVVFLPSPQQPVIAFLHSPQHPFIADVIDNKPLKDLYNEAKAEVIEELEDFEEEEVTTFINITKKKPLFNDNFP